jgi:hypothetical protein
MFRKGKELEGIYPKQELSKELEVFLKELYSPLPPRIRKSQAKQKRAEEKLLEDIEKYPQSGTTERYRRLRLSNYLGNKCVHNLINKGKIVAQTVYTNKGRVKILRIKKKNK